MVVTPELPEVIELEEKQLIMEQITKLQHRIELGGRMFREFDVFFFGNARGPIPWPVHGERERQRGIGIIKCGLGPWVPGSSWMLSTNESWSRKRGKPEIIEHYQKAWLWAAGLVEAVMPFFSTAKVKETWLEKLLMPETGDHFVSKSRKVGSLASSSMHSMSRLAPWTQRARTPITSNG